MKNFIILLLLNSALPFLKIINWIEWNWFWVLIFTWITLLVLSLTIFIMIMNTKFTRQLNDMIDEKSK